MQVPTIHGIPAPNFGGMNQAIGSGSGQPFVFAEDFEDMDLGSGQGDSDVPPHPAFPPQPMIANPNRTSPRDLFAPSRPRDPHDHTSSPSRRPDPNYCQH